MVVTSSIIMIHTLLYFHLRHNQQFFRGYSPRRVFWHHFVEESNSVFKLFETRPSARALCHRTPHTFAELGSFTYFYVCMFKLQFVFVRSDAGEGKRELGSGLLSVRCGSLRVHQKMRTSSLYSLELFCVLCLNALNSFECLNWQGLGWPHPVGWDRRGPPSAVGPYNRHHLSPH